MGMLGLAYTHSDLGGFAGGEKFDAEMYIRWLQYGVFQPVYRPHAQEHIAPEMVFHDSDTIETLRPWLNLRYQLLPYNYTLAYQNSLTGMPLLVLSLCFMLLVFGVIPINDAIVARNTTPAVRGRVYAMKYVLSLTVGAVAVPLVAFMHGTGGFSGMYVVLSFCAAGIVATILFLMPVRVTASQPVAAAGD